MPPLVTIGVPTHNRAGTLARAVESALAQTHGELEVIVFDNASSDGTEEVARGLERADSRVRYVRRPQNLGPEANMDGAIRSGSGVFAMLLADDDRLASDYVERCVAALAERAELALAAGRPVYLRAGAEADYGAPIELLHADPAERVRAYFEAVDDNAPFYGLVRRAVVERQPPMRRVLGFDWLWVAGLAFCGGVARLDETAIYRDLGGASESTQANVRTSGLPPLNAKLPHFAIASHVLAEIGWRSPLYEPLGRRRRLRLASACAASVPRRNLRHVLYHLLPARLQPAASRLARRLEAR